jgi:hypothetical protein
MWVLAVPANVRVQCASCPAPAALRTPYLPVSLAWRSMRWAAHHSLRLANERRDGLSVRVVGRDLWWKRVPGGDGGRLLLAFQQVTT